MNKRYIIKKLIRKEIVHEKNSIPNRITNP